MKCEYILLNIHNDYAVMCHRKAIYEITHHTIFNDTPLILTEYLCSKHSEIKYPFTQLKRIVDNNEL